MECKVRTITPKEASELLGINTANRKLKKTHVAFFEEQLKRGEMQLTHQGIAISISGKLLDGQHRLAAIVNTGISATLLVVNGLPDETFSVLDTGSARSAADVLSVDGAINVTSTAAGIRNYLCYKTASGLIWTGAMPKKLGTTTAVKAEYDANKAAWTWAGSTAQSCVLGKIVVPGPAACLMYLATSEGGYSKSYAQDFLATLKEGADLPAGHPILAYRNKSISIGPNPSSQARLADYIKLFNACATGQKLKIFKSQQYPPMPTLIHASECIYEDAAA